MKSNNKNIVAYIFLAIAFMFFLGKYFKNPDYKDHAINYQKDKIIDELQNEIKNLRKDINDLLSDKTFVQKTAIFTPEMKGYQVIYTNSGYYLFLVSLDNVKKYANGYKVTFGIGNPYSIKFNNIKLNVRWGKDVNHLQSRDVNLDKTFLPGFWNEITVILSPAKSQDTGFILISIEEGKAVILNTDFRKS